MDLGVTQGDKYYISNICLARWKKDDIRYLRVKILASMRGTYLPDHNIIPLINWMKSQFEKWSSLGLSWLGGISAVKLKILLRLLFFFQNKIIFIPSNLLNMIR